ncbi:uncharacterized protein LOC128891922 isoform X1 [Hylaeus anthracinus]|uniref:uncharacterized protein LOC128891922 isoform X1 n=2 Tax=Hylaeus anthracinus TaxID=313031 RepID=UPI0023B92D63|nr:uncharacterized protein LOC128891922 isoform X1 [Hylaeus anthracinus]
MTLQEPPKMFSFFKRKFHSNMCKISPIFISSITNIILENSPNYEAWEKVSRTEERVMTVTKEQVNQLIASNTVVIFSKTKCPYCKMAKEVFDSLNQKYTAIELDERDDGNEIQSILGEMTGARTVPRVFVKEVCLGGGTDVKKLYASGELQKRL